MAWCSQRRTVFVTFVLMLSMTGVRADATFDKLMASGQYKEAIEYADNNLPAANRSADVWVKVGQANAAVDLTEKALACFLVAWRMDAGNYGALLGAAKIYNSMGQYESAMDMAEKALEQKFTGEASWQFAQAAIKLKKPQEAKKALEKVIETDPGNIIANRELGNIYYKEKQYTKAISLLNKAYQAGKNAETALKIGQSYREVGNLDSALVFIEKAVSGGLKSPRVVLDLARIYYGRKQYKEAVQKFDKAAGKAKFTADDHYARAVAKEKVGDEKGALQSYAAAVKAYGASKSDNAIQANLKMATAYYEQEKYSLALKRLSAIKKADPQDKKVPNVNFLLADVYQAMNNQPKAIQWLEKAIAKDQKNYEAYARLAELYEKNGMADKARKTYQKMMALSPNDPKVYLVLGQYNLKMKKYKEALDLLLKSEELSPSAEAAEGVAIASIELNQWNRARESALQALKLNADLVEPRKILSKIYLRAEEYGEARKQLEVLVKKLPREMKYLKQLASCYEKLGEPKKLAGVDKQIIALDKKDTKSRMRRADFLLKNKDLKGAYELYKAVSILEPKNSDALLHIYQIARKLGKKKEAVIYVKKYLALKPKDAERHRDLGDLQYEQKNWQAALNAYRTALKLDPGLKGFYKRYADVVLKKGKQSEVIGALNNLIKRGQADISAYTTLGSIYEKQKQFQKALGVYRQALAIEPQNAELLSSYAACQAKVGDIKGAIITYEQTVMMNPKARDEYRALGKLYERQNKKEQAIKAYMHYLDNGATDHAVARKIGQYGVEKGKYDIAFKYLSTVSGEPANDFMHLLLLGEAAFHVGKYKQTVSAFVRLLERNPKMSIRKKITRLLAEAYEEMGKNVDAAKQYAAYNKLMGGRNADAAYKSAYLQEKVNTAAAIKIYQTNVKRFPRDARNYLRLGLIYSGKKSKLSSSVAMLKKAAALADTVPKVWLELASVYGKLGKTDEELRAYKEYAKHDAQNVTANKRIGLILMKKGQVTNGMVYLETANALSPDDPEIMMALADGYVKTNRTKEAVDLLQKVKAKQPKNVEVRYRLFKLLKNNNRLDDALKEMEGIIQTKRENRYLREYAELLMRMGKTKQAKDRVEDILATDPESIDALMLKAMIARMEKEYDEAVEIYKEISYIDPNNAQALFERAETHMLQSKVQWASTFYNRALRADPEYALAELGLAKIAKMTKRHDAYVQHVKKAYKMNPKHPEIAREYREAVR